MTTPPDDLEEKVDLLLENIKQREKIGELEQQSHWWQGAHRLASLWGCQNYPSLISEASRLIEEDGTNYFARYYRGLAFHRQQEYDKALNDFTRAISLKPYGDFYLRRGITFAHQKEWVKAILDYQKVQELAPEYADAYLWEGRAWHAMGNLEKALENYNQGITHKPEYWPLYHSRGLTWKKMGEEEKAKKDLAQAEILKSKIESKRK